MSGVESGLLTSAYELCREGTLCASAEIEIVPVAATWCCSGCSRTIPNGGILQCPECGLPARLEAGDEIVLERVEMEVP